MNNDLESDVKNKFCCDSMASTIQNYDIIEFEDYLRTYNLLTSPTGIGLKLNFCPFCGQNLGKRLNSEYYDILYKKYGINYPEGTEKDKVPEEFKTDEWWKKRGL